MSDDDAKQLLLASALMGMVNGAIAEAFNEMAKELRRYAGRNFDKCLDGLETKAIRSVENAPIDGIPEHDQLILVERTRAVIAANFRDIRSGT